MTGENDLDAAGWRFFKAAVEMKQRKRWGGGLQTAVCADGGLESASPVRRDGGMSPVSHRF